MAPTDNKRENDSGSVGELMTTRELMTELRLSRVGVWRITNKEGNSFPKAIILGARQKRWMRSEVEAWLDSRPRSAT